MRIAIDINGIDQKSGLGNYLRLLVQNLVTLDKDNEYIFYSHSWAPAAPPAELQLPAAGNFRFISHKIPESLTLLAEYAGGLNLTERLLEKYKVDVFHGPGNIVPRFKKIRSVLTLHHYFSAHNKLAPQNLNMRERLYANCMTYSIKSADHVICDSESTRLDVAALLGPQKEKASVVYLGGPNDLYKVLGKKNSGISGKYGLPEEFLLFVGPVNERKNLPMLLRALKAAGNGLGRHKLVVTGVSPLHYSAVIKELIAELGIEDRVILCGPVEKNDMPWFYNLASALVYPSLFEGFGYPPLEAFSCGCPVAASNATSIPEITGDAALLFDPKNEKAIAESLLTILFDVKLRKELTAKGFTQLKKFSWPETVEKTIALYKKVNASA